MAAVSSRRFPRWTALILIPVLLFGALAVSFLLRPDADPNDALRDALREAEAQNRAALTGPALLTDAAAACFRLEPNGELLRQNRRASGSFTVTRLSYDALTADLAPEMQTLLAEAAAQATRRSELYDESGQFLPALTEAAYRQAVTQRLESAEACCESMLLPISFTWKDGVWQLDDAQALLGLLPSPSGFPGYDEALALLKPVALSYALPDWTSPGPVPDENGFGMSDDVGELLAVLQSETARRLIGSQELDFDPDALLPGRPVYWYLDETILAIVWQQDEHGAVGTFAEVFLADASQLRRKLAGDAYGSGVHAFPTALAAEANAVVGVSGDFYANRTVYGIYVYDGQLLDSCLYAGQSCMIDDGGELHFVYENDFATESDVQYWLDQNRIMFSLSFGPVMVDHGTDVTPYDYPLGEVRDTYARCAFGQLGPLHYLAMTINCESPDHYVYVTLRQAADSMIAHGCYNAYTLDGGQTGSIILGGRLINPVQFGVERAMSDIFYFATALPDS